MMMRAANDPDVQKPEMAEEQQPASRGNTPSLMIPAKRALEDEHTPTVSSPLNPDAKARPTPPKPAAREQREKKDSLKKRESLAGGSAKRDATPNVKPKGKGKTATFAAAGQPSPIRYNHALPREPWAYVNKDAVLLSNEHHATRAPDGSQLMRPAEHIENKNKFHYDHCVADPTFPHMRYYRRTDEKPFGARMSLEDTDKWFQFDSSATIMTNEKGWRSGRANVIAREGRYYYEVKILRGVPADGAEVPQDYNGVHTRPLPHVRMGWSRREAALDTPVGFDGYSYGFSDMRMQPMHRSRAGKYVDDGTDPVPGKKAKSKQQPAKSKEGTSAVSTAAVGFDVNDSAREGDVIGLEINLPSLIFHRKVVDGYYNPLVDTGAGLDDRTVSDEGAPNIVRDRFPVPYKSAMYFESMDYVGSKGMSSYGDRGPFSRETPDPNHEDVTLRNLPHSSIKVYKNGKRIGTAFRNLMAFLPPASNPHVEKGTRTGLDDGSLGYYPTVSCFTGGIAQVNFGPEFWCPPQESGGEAEPEPAEVKREAEDTVMGGTEEEPPRAGSGVANKPLRPISDRYTEQIAEDIVYDIIDEVDFYMQDGGASLMEE